MVNGDGRYPEFLYCLLPRRKNRRPFYVPVQEQTDLNCCHPNALMTLMEYLQDYASPKTKEIGMKLIEKELDNIPNEKVRKVAEEHLRDIENGQRDFRF